MNVTENRFKNITDVHAEFTLFVVHISKIALRIANTAHTHCIMHTVLEYVVNSHNAHQNWRLNAYIAIWAIGGIISCICLYK